MRCSRPCDVTRLPLSQREKENISRSQKGFHVFLSRYFLDFSNLNYKEKEATINKFKQCRSGCEVPLFTNRSALTPLDSNASIVSLDDSFDSTDTPPSINHTDIMKLACSVWKCYPKSMRASWNKRADYLNRLPVPGRIEQFPDALQGEGGLEGTLIDLLFFDWKDLCNRIRNSIKRPPKNELCPAVYRFGHERVVMNSQTYRKMTLSSLLRLYLFNKDKIQRNIIKETKRMVLLHIASQSRVKEIFLLPDYVQQKLK